MFLFELGKSLLVSTVKTQSFRKKGLYRACLDENILKFSEKLFYISIAFGQLYLLYPFHSAASFYSRWKHQKTRGFLMFSGGIERELVVWNGLTYLCICLSNPTRSSWLRLITQFLSLQKTRICKTIFLNKSFDSSEFCLFSEAATGVL